MKNKYSVKVRETYSRLVTVFVNEDEDEVFDRIAEMHEYGEIKWDRAADFVSWDITSCEQADITPEERSAVTAWCQQTVRTVASLYPKQIIDMDEPECLQWFASLQNLGINIPPAASDYDLWEAVLAEKEIYAEE